MSVISVASCIIHLPPGESILFRSELTKMAHEDSSERRITDKDRLEAYRAFSAQLHDQYNQRRELEWKIHVSIWTLISAVGYLLISHEIYIGPKVMWLFVMVPLHLIWCVKIHTGGFRDQYLSVRYRQAAENLLTQRRPIDDEAEHAPHPPKRLRAMFRWYGWWLVAEVGTTFLLIAGIVYITWSEPGHSPNLPSHVGRLPLP